MKREYYLSLKAFENARKAYEKIYTDKLREMLEAGHFYDPDIFISQLLKKINDDLG